MSFQSQVYGWMVRCFGKRITDDRKTRGLAFIEEALELAQATGITKEEVLKQLEYTYGRPVGLVRQEVGGVMICLAALCNEQGISIDKCSEEEMTKCQLNTNKIRAKQYKKVEAGIRHLTPEDV